MRASWKIGRLAGITVRMHATFPLLLVWIAVMHYAGSRRWSDVAAALVYTLGVFGIVVLHELGHALAARKFGIRTRDITLLPIGGIARLDRIPERPQQEFWIAVAGPAVNLVLAGGLFALLALGGLAAGSAGAWPGESPLVRLAWLNAGMAAFNLLPAFPLDGGRVLRALLALRLDYGRATLIAVVVGKALAGALGVLGLFANPWLALLAVFVWLGAEQEGCAARLRAVFAGVPVEDVMVTEFHTLSPGDPLQRAVDFTVAARQQHFPVVAAGESVGVLRWEDLLAGLAELGPTGRVEEWMRRRPVGEPVERAIGRVCDEDFRALPVIEEGRVVGHYTKENLADSLRLREAMARARARRWARPAGAGDARGRVRTAGRGQDK